VFVFVQSCPTCCTSINPPTPSALTTPSPTPTTHTLTRVCSRALCQPTSPVGSCQLDPAATADAPTGPPAGVQGEAPLPLLPPLRPAVDQRSPLLLLLLRRCAVCALLPSGCEYTVKLLQIFVVMCVRSAVGVVVQLEGGACLVLCSFCPAPPFDASTPLASPPASMQPHCVHPSTWCGRSVTAATHSPL